MATIKVVYFKHNTLQNGEHPIYLRVTQDRKSRYIKLGISCKEEMWDEKSKLPLKSHPDYDEMATLIENKSSAARKMLLMDEIDDKERSVEEIQSRLKKKRNNKITVYDYFEIVITRFKEAGRLGNAAVYRATINSLKKFRDQADFQFSDVNLTFLNRYEESFKKRGVTMNSIFVHMRTFKTLINFAKRDEVVRTDYDPFKDYSFKKFRSIKTKKRALSKREISKIAKYKTIPGSSIDLAKKVFMFSYFTSGTNFTDICYLKWENVVDDRLEFIRKKTKKQMSIGLLPPAIEILNYFKERHYDGKDGYIFPILKRHYQRLQSIDNRIVKILRIVNEDLKTIAKKCGIKEVLTTYVARHSYATILKKSGVSTAIISESMGHQNERTTQIYLDSFDKKVLDNANKAILLGPTKKSNKVKIVNR